MDPDFTNEQKTKIAAEVIAGERDPSDLAKYGITIGEPVEIDPETFMKILELERPRTCN